MVNKSAQISRVRVVDDVRALISFFAGGLISGLVYGVAPLLRPNIEWFEFVQWPILESMLALSFGCWIIWHERLVGKRTAAQIVGRKRRESISRVNWSGAGCFDARRRVNSDAMRLRV